MSDGTVTGSERLTPMVPMLRKVSVRSDRSPAETHLKCGLTLENFPPASLAYVSVVGSCLEARMAERGDRETGRAVRVANDRDRVTEEGPARGLAAATGNDQSASCDMLPRSA